MKKTMVLGVIIMFYLTLAGCGKAGTVSENMKESVNLNVSAAASLKDVAEELKDLYFTQRTNVKIAYNFASSGTLQKQIEEGAPVDLFISAGKTQMDVLAEKGLIVNSSRVNLLGNQIVLIAGKQVELDGFKGLAGDAVARVSIGTPETVPAGKHAKETLAHLGLWEEFQPKLVLAKDVRQVLTYVETGNVDAGMVFYTDAIVGEVRVIATAPPGSHDPIVYPMAVIKDSKHQEEALAYAEFLLSDEAAAVFSRYGFTRLNS